MAEVEEMTGGGNTSSKSRRLDLRDMALQAHEISKPWSIGILRDSMRASYTTS